MSGTSIETEAERDTPDDTVTRSQFLHGHWGVVAGAVADADVALAPAEQSADSEDTGDFVDAGVSSAV